MLFFISLLSLLDISCREYWIAGSPSDENDPRLLAMAADHRHFLENDYNYTVRDSTASDFCRAAALMVSSNDHEY